MLGNLLAEDGHSNVAVLYQNDSYGTGLNEVFKEVFDGHRRHHRRGAVVQHG